MYVSVLNELFCFNVFVSRCMLLHADLYSSGQYCACVVNGKLKLFSLVYLQQNFDITNSRQNLDISNVFTRPVFFMPEPNITNPGYNELNVLLVSVSLYQRSTVL